MCGLDVLSAVSLNGDLTVLTGGHSWVAPRQLRCCGMRMENLPLQKAQAEILCLAEQGLQASLAPSWPVQMQTSPSQPQWDLSLTTVVVTQKSMRRPCNDWMAPERTSWSKDPHRTPESQSLKGSLLQNPVHSSKDEQGKDTEAQRRTAGGQGRMTEESQGSMEATCIHLSCPGQLWAAHR